MGAARDGDPPLASSRDFDGFLDFFEGLRAEVEFWSRVEGSGPCLVGVLCVCAKGSRRIDLGEFCLDLVVHGEMWYCVVGQESVQQRKVMEARDRDRAGFNRNCYLS